jgi:hypothetical protein
MPMRGVVVGEAPAATVPGMASQAMPAMEDDMEEGNAFTLALKRTPKGGKFSVGGNTFTDTSNYEESMAFESLDKQLTDLLTEGERVEEGMSVSISKGQQGAPDSVTVSAQDSEAEKLLSFIKQTGLGLFGDEGGSNYGSPGQDSPTHSHGDINVVDDHDGMMSIMKKISGIDSQGGDGDDYRDEEHHDDHDHEEACEVCGESECGCEESQEMVDEVETYDQEEEEVAEAGMDEDLTQLQRLAGTVPQREQPAPASDQKRGMQEDNPPDSGEAESTADEDAEAAEDKALALKSVNEGGDGGEASEEPEEEMSESEEDDDKEKLDEWANDAGKRSTETTFVTDEDFMINTITSGLNKRKATGQTTIPVIPGQKERMGSDSLNEWKRLAGI